MIIERDAARDADAGEADEQSMAATPYSLRAVLTRRRTTPT
jgi:hypothetical protein